MNRRDFLRASGGAAAAITLTPILAAPSPNARPTPSEPWFDKPMLWAQLTLVENDPGQFDPQFWIDYFKRTHSDAACLSAGGVVAYYPTEVPLHHRSAWLGSGDPFRTLLEGCRGLGMVVIARTDSHAVHEEAQKARPDWIAVDASGKPRRHWASPEMWVTCALGPYNFEHMTAIHEEIMRRYAVDGIFINRWDGSGMCYCEHCQKNFHAATGRELPRSNDPADPTRRAHNLWRQTRLFELWQLWEERVRKINPGAHVIPNTGGGATSSLDMNRIGELAQTLMADRQARRGLTVPWAAGKNGKEYRATMGRKPIVGIFSVGLEEPYRWKDSVQSEPEIRLWVADAVAQGLRPWFTKFAGTIHDPRWLETVESIYNRYHRWEPYLRNEAPLAQVGLVYSQQTGWFYSGSSARTRVEDSINGFYHALVEGRIPFEMVHDQRLAPDQLRAFKTLLLPNVAALSDEQCQQIRQFVASGGSIVATFETSLYDERGQRRSNFGLADLFNADFAGRVEGPMQNSYLRLQKDPVTNSRHPILAGLEGTPRIVNGVHRVGTRAREPFHSPLALVPSYPDLPMEKVFPRGEPADQPELYLRQLGAGRVVYFPWDIDRTFWEVLATDHATLILNAIRWASPPEPVVSVHGPGLLDISVWRQKTSLTVHLVNLTNPMAMKGPIRELLPIGEQTVRIQLPDRTVAKRVRLLALEREAIHEQNGRNLTVTVPSVLDHEIVAIDL